MRLPQFPRRESFGATARKEVRAGRRLRWLIAGGDRLGFDWGYWESYWCDCLWLG
jgi:hypothetical protein